MAQQIKIILRENKKLSLLKEITIEQALVAVNSKATKKIIYKYSKHYSDLQVAAKTRSWEDGYTAEHLSRLVETITTIFKEQIVKHLPEDIDENDKAQCVIWMKNYLLQDYRTFHTFCILNDYNGEIPYFLERFFQMKNFIEPQENRDLHKIKNLHEFDKIIKDATPRYKAWLDKKQNLDAKAGTEVIYEDNEWTVYIPNNKGAACELGKGTSWCTAAPGLDYYNQYHKPNDPLFIFINKQDPEMKYQFHYGTGQFMDKDDMPIIDTNSDVQDDYQQVKELFLKLHNILVKTVGKKYPFLNEYFMETDLGLVRKVRDGNEKYGSFGYISGNRYRYAGQDKPSSIEYTLYSSEKYNDVPDIYRFEIFFRSPPTAEQRKHDDLRPSFSSKKYPSTIRLSYDLEKKKFFLTEMSWYIRDNENIALLDPMKEIWIEEGYEEEWQQYYQQYFEREIKPDPTKWAVNVLMQNIPEDFKEKVFNG